MRLCPVIPFTLFNFAIGITSMSLRDYCIGMLAIIPTTVAYVFLGTTISDIEDAIEGKNNFQDNMGLLLFVILGSLLAIGGLIYITYVANKILQEMMQEDSSEEEGAGGKNRTGENNDDSNLHPRTSASLAEDRQGDDEEEKKQLLHKVDWKEVPDFPKAPKQDPESWTTLYEQIPKSEAKQWFGIVEQK